MKILFKDMEIPENCGNCPYYVHRGHHEYVCEAIWCPRKDVVSRQAVLDNAYAYGNGLEPEGYCVNVEDIQALPSAQPKSFHNITMTDVLRYLDNMPEDVWQEFVACLECRGWRLVWKASEQCDDAVSRSDCLQALSNLMDIDGFRNGGAVSRSNVECMLKSMPSVMPEPCEDTVSRKKVFEYFVSLWDCIGTIMDRDEWEDVCKTTANELPSAQPEQQWIPINKRPPEQYGNYLVLYKTDPEPDIGTFDPRTGLWTACDANGCYYIASKGLEVIAWKPLPKSWGEDENQ